MSFTLYSATVPTYIQMLGALSHLIDKAERHCAEHDLEPVALLKASLAPDMLPFAKQVEQAVHHAVGGLEGARAGQFSPSLAPPPIGFAALKAHVQTAIEALQTVQPEEVNALAEKPCAFVFGDFRLPFTGDNFLSSFSLPNFYFHTTTAYAILRNHGVALGKQDYMGRLRISA